MAAASFCAINHLLAIDAGVWRAHPLGAQLLQRKSTVCAPKPRRAGWRRSLPRPILHHDLPQRAYYSLEVKLWLDLAVAPRQKTPKTERDVWLACDAHSTFIYFAYKSGRSVGEFCIFACERASGAQWGVNSSDPRCMHFNSPGNSSNVCTFYGPGLPFYGLMKDARLE